MREVVLDVETTTKNNGAVFDPDNKLCYVGTYEGGVPLLFPIEWEDRPYGQFLKGVETELLTTDVLIGFNLKFDLNWLRRYTLRPLGRIFDVQLAWYILTGQKHPYPSLNGVAEYYGLGTKLDVVKGEYWDKGLDTTDVPTQILEDYLAQDLALTWQCYEKVKEDLANSSREMQQLVKVSMEDLLVLADMEWNGMKIDVNKSVEKGDEIVETLSEIDGTLRGMLGFDRFNPNSGEHISALLFGGVVKVPYRESYKFTYKDGREVWKERNAIMDLEFPRRCLPLKGSELAKEGYYSTDAATLTTVRVKAKKTEKIIIDKLLQRAKLEKLRSTYYHGLPKKMALWNWKDGVVHTTLNQCVATTGRLSSSKPNVQNIQDEFREVFITRF